MDAALLPAFTSADMVAAVPVHYQSLWRWAEVCRLTGGSGHHVEWQPGDVAIIRAFRLLARLGCPKRLFPGVRRILLVHVGRDLLADPDALFNDPRIVLVPIDGSDPIVPPVPVNPDGSEYVIPLRRLSYAVEDR